MQDVSTPVAAIVHGHVPGAHSWRPSCAICPAEVGTGSPPRSSSTAELYCLSWIWAPLAAAPRCHVIASSCPTAERDSDAGETAGLFWTLASRPRCQACTTACGRACAVWVLAGSSRSQRACVHRWHRIQACYVWHPSPSAEVSMRLLLSLLGCCCCSGAAGRALHTSSTWGQAELRTASIAPSAGTAANRPERLPAHSMWQIRPAQRSGPVSSVPTTGIGPCLHGQSCA